MSCKRGGFLTTKSPECPFLVGKNENNSETILRKKSKIVYGTESLF